MSLYDAYLEQIKNRNEQELKPKPIDDGGLVKELVAQIKDASHAHRAASRPNPGTHECQTSV